MIDEKILMELLQAEKSKNQVIDDYTHGIQTGLRRAIKLTYDQPKVGEWEPFTDGYDKEERREILKCALPDDEQEILVTVGDNVCMDTFMRDGEECYLENGYELVKEATAWMPLPEPYKESGRK